MWAEKDDIVTTAIPPVLPKAGEVYLFKPDEEAYLTCS